MRLASIALMVALAMPFPVLGQSAETCIAYMEADAIYEVAEDEANAVGERACSNATAPFVQACQAARETSGQACRDANDALDKYFRSPPRDVGNVEYDRRMRALMGKAREACRQIDTACDFERYSENGRAISKACSVARKLVRDPLVEEANIEWGRAYSRAYQGPTSDIPSVFQKLVIADRERCRQRGM